MLEEIQGIEAAARAALGQRGERYQITKVRYSHDGMIDLIVQNPWVSQHQLGQHFGYSDAWISTVMATDAFKAKLALRREEIVDPVLRATVEERFKAVVTRSLEVLQEKLSNPIVSQIPDNLALRAAELGAKALGLGGNAPPQAPPPNDAHLSLLASRLIALQRTVRADSGMLIEDVEVRELAPAPSNLQPSLF